MASDLKAFSSASASELIRSSGPLISTKFAEKPAITALIEDFKSNLPGNLGLANVDRLSKQLSAATKGSLPMRGPLLAQEIARDKSLIGNQWLGPGATNLLGPRDSTARFTEKIASDLKAFSSASASELIRSSGPLISTKFAEKPAITALIEDFKSNLPGNLGLANVDRLSKQLSAATKGSLLLQGGLAEKTLLSQLNLEPKMASLALGIRRVPTLFSRLEEVEQELQEADPSCARLSVLLDKVGVGRALFMMERMVSEGSKPLVDVLAEILLRRSALLKFEAVIRASDLPRHVEGDLLHALEHLAEESPDHALPPLLNGLEGALRHAVRLKGDQKQRSNARSLAAALGMQRDHELLVGAIYSHANDGRHGAELDRRDACVLTLVGLVLWMTECCNQPAMEWLEAELDRRLQLPVSVAA